MDNPHGVDGASPVSRESRLLVPLVRPGLEWVLEGRRSPNGYGWLCRSCGRAWETLAELEQHNIDICPGDSVWIPVRAFEIVAGEEGRVRDGKLEKLHPESGMWLELTDLAMHSPWRDAWDAAFANDAIMFGRDTPAGTMTYDGPVYLVGPTVRGNFYGLSRHELRRPRNLDIINDAALKNAKDAEAWFHGTKCVFELCPSLFGIQWRLGDQAVAQVLRKEMGL